MKLPHGCMGVPPGILRSPCAIGVDVRFGSYDVAIGCIERPEPDRNVCKLLFSGKVPDDDAVEFLMKQYKVVAGVGDARPDATVMARLQARARRNRIQFYRAQYATAPSNVEMTINGKEHLLTLERTMTLDNVFYAVSTGLGVALPQNFHDISNGEFAREMCASTRIPVIWHGEQWSRWTESGADHSFHAMNYLMVAIKVGKLHLHRDSVSMAIRGQVESTLEENYDDEDEQIDWRGGVVLEA